MRIDAVEYLVSAACDINAQSNSGRTALWKAAQSGRREIVHLLYALGAALDVRSQVGKKWFRSSPKMKLNAMKNIW